MLILTRNVKENIIINNDIHLYVLAICNQQVRLGFQAPPSVLINREEVWKKLNKV